MTNPPLREALDLVLIEQTEFESTVNILVMLLFGLAWAVLGHFVDAVVPPLDQCKFVIPLVGLPLYGGLMAYRVWQKRPAARPYHRIAERIEARWPDLGGQLIRAVAADVEGPASGASTDPATADLLTHFRQHDWRRVIPKGRRLFIQGVSAVVVVAIVLLIFAYRKRFALPPDAAAPAFLVATSPAA